MNKEQKTKKIMMIEDHPLLRQGIKNLIATTDGLSLDWEAASVAQANGILARNTPDLILLDISLPDGNGIELLSSIKKALPSVPVLILTMHTEEPYLRKTIELGASGYIVKDMAPEKLLEAITCALKGETYFMLNRPKENPELESAFRSPFFANLSTQEMRVMRSLVDGKGLTEIAQELQISVKTVSTYRTRILQKLGIKNNAELVRIAMTY